jgi:hypothetical protein
MLSCGGMDRSDEFASLPGQDSRVFSGKVGRTSAAVDVVAGDYIVDRSRFDSEGDWAFCRFSSPQIPAVRFGYQLGSFDIGPEPGARDPSLLQLHLEVMTADGGLLWVPTGRYDGELLDSSPDTKDVKLSVDGTEILRISGWPRMSWQMRSDDDQLEVSLDVDIGTVTVLPDCLLPQSVFAMWETLGRARGFVRVGSNRVEVEGHMFFDHTRVRHVRHAVPPRSMYLYTTLALDDGSGIFGYHAVDESGLPIDYYCFGIHVDASGHGTFLETAEVSGIEFDDDGLPCAWHLDWHAEKLAVEASVSVQPLPLKKGWGGPSAPESRASWTVFPLVLDSTVRVTRLGATTEFSGQGLAEYFDAEHWFEKS